MKSLVVASLAALFLASAAAAQNYPTRPIRLIVPFSPGGGTDINARILQDPLGNVLGQTVVVDNRPGAGSVLGTDLAAQSTPDGYTILLCSASLVVNSVVFKKLPFDVRRDLAPITPVADQPNLDRKSTRLNSSHMSESRMPSSA